MISNSIFFMVQDSNKKLYSLHGEVYELGANILSAFNLKILGSGFFILEYLI